MSVEGWQKIRSGFGPAPDGGLGSAVFGVRIRKSVTGVFVFLRGAVISVLRLGSAVGVICVVFSINLAEAAKAGETDWTKFFIGGQIGFGWNDFNISIAPPEGESESLRPLEDFNGVVAGVQVGKNFYQAATFVAGIVADFNWNAGANSRSSSEFSSICQAHSEVACLMTTEVANSTVSLNSNWDASIRGRAGFLPLPDLLIYGTAGVAFVGVSVRSWRSTTDYLPWGPTTTSMSASDEGIVSGYVIGVGAEGLVMPSVGLFVQLLHYGFDDTNLRLYRSHPSVSIDKSIIEMGVRLYFN